METLKFEASLNLLDRASSMRQTMLSSGDHARRLIKTTEEDFSIRAIILKDHESLQKSWKKLAKKVADTWRPILGSRFPQEVISKSDEEFTQWLLDDPLPMLTVAFPKLGLTFRLPKS